MNEDINQEILNELRKTNRMNRAGVGISILALLILGVYFVALRPALLKKRQPASAAQSAETRPWDEVRDAVDTFDYPKAVKLLEGTIARQPSYYYGYAYLGNVYLMMGNVTNAEAQYAKAFELLPDPENEKMLTAIRRRLAKENSTPSAASP